MEKHFTVKLYQIQYSDLSPTNFQSLNLPVGSQILSTRLIDSEIFLWVKFDTRETNFESCRICTIKTNGQVLIGEDKDLQFIDTIFRHNEFPQSALHLFIVTETDIEKAD